MKNNRTTILIVLVALAVALTSISLFAFAYAGANATIIYPNATASGTNGYYPNGMMGDHWSGMMSGMMGGNWGSSSTVQTPTAVQNTILPLIGFAALIGAILTGAGGIVYYLAVPKNRIAKPKEINAVGNSPKNPAATPYASVSKTLTTEERKVLDVIASHDGKYLQKYIRAEAGLSRLKTHRIVARLAERGIVTLEKSGNTNEVHLSSWLQSKPDMNEANKKNDRLLEIEVRARK